MAWRELNKDYSDEDAVHHAVAGFNIWAVSADRRYLVNDYPCREGLACRHCNRRVGGLEDSHGFGASSFNFLTDACSCYLADFNIMNHC